VFFTNKGLNIPAMIQNFLKIAFRNLLRSAGFSVINIVGLAVGISVTILIGMWVYDEVSYNTCHEHYDNIAQLHQHQTFGNDISTSVGVPMPLGPELKTDYKALFKTVVHAWWRLDHILSVHDQKTSQNGTFMDPEALEMFSFKMLKGNYASLKDPASIVLSESAARALFGDEDPIDKMLRIDNSMDVKVTGVYAEFPHNSWLHSLKFISTWDFWVASNDWMKQQENDWNGDAGNIFVELQPNTSVQSAAARIKEIKSKRINKEQAARENPQLGLHPMSRWYLHSEWKNGKETGARAQLVWLVGIIGIFVLLLACINFMNLSTARSEKRAKEVGIRKSIGSLRGQLIYQFLSESLVLVMIAFVVALALVTVSLPGFNELADKRIEVPWTNLSFWLISFAFIFITGLLAGSYPALYLSSFQPVKVLKGTFKAGRFAAVPRKTLVVVQFTVSIALIMGTIIVYRQIQFAKNRPIGYDRQGLIMIRKTSHDFWGKFDALKNALKASGAITEMAGSSSPATDVWFKNSGFTWKGQDPNMHAEFATMAVTHEFGKTMGWTFLQGRDYDREFSTDSSAIILNEAAVKFMGLKDPVNEEITWDGKKFTVIGVIQDMIMGSPYEPVKQTVFWLNYDQTIWINIRINPVMSSHEALAKIEKVFQTLIPQVPFDYKFTDQEYALKFSGEERIGKLASFFATLAIFISCLGLFGMSSFVAEQRQKEIGVRKILGASVLNIWKMLSLEFIALVSVSCLIGLPIAWYSLHQWLQNYEYRTEISVWVFVTAISGALFITLLTVSFQTLKASIANPVKSLRAE
jgi:putative ABC transport system permease protein